MPPPPFAAITLKNNSSQAIESVRIIRGEERAPGEVILVENIAAKTSKCAEIYAAPEASYFLVVHFRGGATIKTLAVYVEAFDEVTETISSAGIKTEVKSSWERTALKK